MARFDGPRERKSRDFKGGSSRDSSSNRGFRSKSSFDDNPRGRSRGPPRGRSSRNDLEMTQVVCDGCGEKCEVPFKPTSNKPVYCKECFSKQDKQSSNKGSEHDFDMINEKLNKIMAALKIK